MRDREWFRFYNGLWDIHGGVTDRDAWVRERSAESARESQRRSVESRRSLDVMLFMIRHPPGEQYQPEGHEGSFQTHLGWSMRAFRRVGHWVANVACRYTSTNAGRLLVMSPYSKLLMELLTIEDAFNAYAARLNNNWTDAFSMKLLREMEHFDHDCECNLHSLPVGDSSHSIIPSPRGPDVLMLRRVARAPKDYLDACFLVRKNVSPHYVKPLQLNTLPGNMWRLAVVGDYSLRPVAFSLAAAIAASDELWWDTTHYPVPVHDAVMLSELLNRQPHLLGLPSDSEKLFVESQAGDVARTPIEAHWHSIRIRTSGATSCAYCSQIVAKLLQPLTRPFDRFVSRTMSGVEGCSAILQPLKKTLQTLKAQGQLAHVGCVRLCHEFLKSSGLLAGVTSTGVVCGVSWGPD